MSSPSRLIIWSDVSVVLVSGRTLLEATTCAAIAFREERGGCWEPSLVAGEGWGEIGMGGSHWVSYIDLITVQHIHV